MYYVRRHQLQKNIAYHVFNRGNGRYDIFHDHKDYWYFKSLLSAYSRQKAMNIYHWVIMPNHYHLLIEIAMPEKLSSIMAGINRSYTIYYHKRYDTVGFLWQGRFKSQPIQKDRYLFACGRYIERNPVKSWLSCHVEDYTHSSARYYVRGEHDNVTVENPIYETFGANKRERQICYREFLLNFDSQDTKQFNDFSRPLGDKHFKQRFVKKQGHYIPRRQGRIYKN